MKEYVERLMKMFSKEKDKKTKTQNLVFLVIMLTFALICINAIYKEDSVQTLSKNKDTQKDSNKIEESNYNSTEKNLQNILGQISGISDVSVMITYSSDEKMIPVYDVKEDITVEENGDGDVSKKSQKTTTEKTVAYEEVNGAKVAIVESKKSPDIIGVIIAAKGIDSNMTNRIKEAVSNTLDIPIHKVEVFSK